MKYRSTKAVTSFALVAVLTSMISGVATANNVSTEFTTTQSTSSLESAKWKLVETFEVPVDSSVIKSKTVLKQGESYKIRAWGTANVNTSGGGLGDAEFGDFGEKNLLMDHCNYSTSNTDIGLSINDNKGTNTKLPRWGKYNELHDYSTYMIGAGLPIELTYHDCDYSDNSGSLTIQIYREVLQILDSGLFDSLRLNDSNRNLKEVASQTFRVEGTVAAAGFRSLKNLKSIVVSEQTFGRSEISYAPNARELMTRLPDPLSKTNSDFSFYEDEYYDVFYSNADGSFNPDGAFITIEGVWRQEGVTDSGGGMNINDVGLSFGGPNPRVQYADYVSSFKLGSICDVSKDNHCKPNSPGLAVDSDPSTFPRFGQTSDRNLTERFRLTIGFKRLQSLPGTTEKPVRFQTGK